MSKFVAEHRKRESVDSRSNGLGSRVLTIATVVDVCLDIFTPFFSHFLHLLILTMSNAYYRMVTPIFPFIYRQLDITPQNNHYFPATIIMFNGKRGHKGP